MKRLLAILAVAVALSSAPARAEEEAEAKPHGIVNWWSFDYGPKTTDPTHKDWPPPFGFAIVNFGIFLVIMSRLLGRPLTQMVRDRHDTIKNDLDEARKLREGAQAMLAEYQKKVQNVDAEVEALLESIRKEAEAEKLRIIAAAEEQAKRLKLDADKQIAAEIDRAKNELRRGVIEAAIAAAEQILQKQIGSDDQRKMAERYVTGVEAQGKTTGAS